MRRASKIGELPGLSGSPVGSIQYFSATPSAAWLPIDSLTEAQIALLRRVGALSKTPLAGRVGATSPSGISGGGSSYSWPGSRQFWAVGDNGLYFAPSTPHSNGLSGWIVQFSNALTGAVTATIQGTSATATSNPLGICFPNAKLLVLTDTGIYENNGGTFTRYGTTAIGGSSSYNQAVYGAGKYVAWSAGAGGAVVPKYSSDLITWNSCTLPTLSVDGSSAGGVVSWIIWDAVNARFIATTLYGETLTSTDGITFTKTQARTGGGTTQGIKEFVRTNTGKLAAISAGLSNSQIYLANDETSAFTASSLTISGKTFGSPAKGIAYTAGVLAATFSSATATSTSTALAVSLDDAATWLFVTGGDGSKSGADSGQGSCLAKDGYIYGTCQSAATSDFSGNTLGDIALTDAFPVIQARIRTIVNPNGGATAKPYIRAA